MPNSLPRISAKGQKQLSALAERDLGWRGGGLGAKNARGMAESLALCAPELSPRFSAPGGVGERERRGEQMPR